MIWCVEDDASIRDIEVYALQSTGFEAKGFEDGQVFWDALQKEAPELVILDVMLPGLDGIELLRRMKSSSISVPSRAFILSGSRRTVTGRVCTG